jgi:hypothetical protein
MWVCEPLCQSPFELSPGAAVEIAPFLERLGQEIQAEGHPDLQGIQIHLNGLIHPLEPALHDLEQFSVCNLFDQRFKQLR